MAPAASEPQVWQRCIKAKGWAGPGWRRVEGEGGEGMLLLRAGGAAVLPSPPSLFHPLHSPPLPPPKPHPPRQRDHLPPPSPLLSLPSYSHMCKHSPAPSLPAWQQTVHNSTHSNTRTHAHASRPSGNLEWGYVTHRPEGVGLPHVPRLVNTLEVRLKVTPGESDVIGITFVNNDIISDHE